MRQDLIGRNVTRFCIHIAKQTDTRRGKGLSDRSERGKGDDSVSELSNSEDQDSLWPNLNHLSSQCRLTAPDANAP